MATGSRHGLYYVQENADGSLPANPKFKALRHTSTTLGLSKNTNQSEELRSDRQISCFRHGAYQIGGDIGIELSYQSFDDLLEAVLCGDWVTGKPAVGTDQLKVGVKRRSFAILRHFSDMDSSSNPYHLFRGVEFNNLSLQINSDSLVTGSFTAVGRDMGTLSALPTGATLVAPASSTCPVDSFSGELKEGGVRNAVISEIQFNLENGLNPRFVVGSKASIAPDIGRCNVSGQVSSYYEDSLLLNKFINETASSLEFTLPDEKGNKYKFILPRVKYTGGDTSASGDASIINVMQYQALLKDSEGTNLIIERTPKK